MEEEKEVLKHVCKFCGKSFSCGRSLGGHMRSHMINDISAQADGTKLTKKKLPSIPNNNNSNNKTNNNGVNYNNTTSTETTGYGYGLRENPKKTWRIADHSSEDNNNNNNVSSLVDKSSKDCGKIFQSWKAFCGHMKCHSLDKEKGKNSNNNSLEEEQDSWTSASNQKEQLVMDSQSDNETTAAPNQRKRSKRRVIRYMGTANSSSLSFANNHNNNASSSASEIEQEQEEVAMCLMMLSRDVGQWGGLNNYVAESSDNNSVFIETNNFVSSNGTETVKVESRKTEFSISGIPRKGLIKNDKAKKSNLDYDECEVELGSKNFSKETGLDSRKRKFMDSVDPETKSGYLKKLTVTNASDSDTCKNSRFECTTCNKVFHSYQALGGHRASHKKTKGCFASRIDSGENSIETEQQSPDPTADSKQLIIKSIKNEISVDNHHLATDYCENKAETSYGAKKSKGHECPICLKVFPSGQALGGHKRSHLVGGTDQAKNNQTISIREPIPPNRDFLDLNLPAPVEEECNGLMGFNPWWIGSSHKHEPLIGLISN